MMGRGVGLRPPERKARTYVVLTRMVFAGAGCPSWVLDGTCTTVGAKHHCCAEQAEG